MTVWNAKVLFCKLCNKRHYRVYKGIDFGYGKCSSCDGELISSNKRVNTVETKKLDKAKLECQSQ